MSHAQSAVYGSKLEGNRIRLLKVEESHAERELRFSLLHGYPEPFQEYTAVSYTWGTAAETESIIINDQPFWVRPNLYTCLYCLSSRVRYMWVDALCINQQDTIEKKSQIRIMDQIYRNADRVAVWLGPETPQQIQEDNILLSELTATRSEWRRQILDMSSRPYWSRRWIIQEFLLAQEVHLHFGHMSIDSISFFEMLQEALLKDPLGSPAEGQLRRAECEVACSLLQEKQLIPYDYKRPLYELLIRHAAAQCSNPKDKVFAFLGVTLKDEEQFFAEYLPDYDLDYEQVLVITFAHLRKMSGRKPVKPLMQALDLDSKVLRNVIRQAEKLDRRFAKEQLSEPSGMEDPENAAMMAEGMRQVWLVNLEDRIGWAFEALIYGHELSDDATIESMLWRYLPWQKWTLSYALIRLGQFVAPFIYAITIYVWIAMVLIFCLFLSAFYAMQALVRRLYQSITAPLLKTSSINAQTNLAQKRNRQRKKRHKAKRK